MKTAAYLAYVRIFKQGQHSKYRYPSKRFFTFELVVARRTQTENRSILGVCEDFQARTTQQIPLKMKKKRLFLWN